MVATATTLTTDLGRLGIAEGDLVMVHAGLRSLGPVIGGAASVVRALLTAVGPTGTLAAYVDYEPFHAPDEPNPPVFDKFTARAALDHGVLAETIRPWPGWYRRAARCCCSAPRSTGSRCCTMRRTKPGYRANEWCVIASSCLAATGRCGRASRNTTPRCRAWMGCRRTSSN